MSDIRFEGWLHRSGTGGVYQDSAGNVGIASTQPQQKLDIGNGEFQVGPTGIATVTTINTTNLINATQLSHRNLIINGAMKIAQRGTSFTATNTYPVDRFKVTNIQVDEATTQSQHTLTSSDTGPYGEGFRKSLHIQNGNQTGGAGGSDRITFNQSIEAQDLANSGWDYTSSSSYVTLQFWVRSSVEQNFNFYLMTSDGTVQIYPMVTGTLSANTWTKITKSIPGNSNITINDDNGTGLVIEWSPFMGTNYTSNSTSNDVWAAAGDYTTRTPDQTSTWYTTNDATFEITGVQFELGSAATPFEHRSFGDELARCQRYFYMHANGSVDGNGSGGSAICDNASAFNGDLVFFTVDLPVTMRTKPSLVASNGSGDYGYYVNGSALTGFDTLSLDGVTTRTVGNINFSVSSAFSGGQSVLVRTKTSDATMAFSAEL